jgi:hypothetical protein
MSELWGFRASHKPIKIDSAVRGHLRTDQLLALLVSEGTNGSGMARPSDGDSERPLPELRVQMDQERNAEAKSEEPHFAMRFGSLSLL